MYTRMIVATATLACLASCTSAPRPIADALIEWSKKTGYNIIVPPCTEIEKASPTVRGSDPLDTLRQLLADTKLEYSQTNSHTVAISCPAEEDANEEPVDGSPTPYSERWE